MEIPQEVVEKISKLPAKEPFLAQRALIEGFVTITRTNVSVFVPEQHWSLFPLTYGLNYRDSTVSEMYFLNVKRGRAGVTLGTKVYTSQTHEPLRRLQFKPFSEEVAPPESWIGRSRCEILITDKGFRLNVLERAPKKADYHRNKNNGRVTPDRPKRISLGEEVAAAVRDHPLNFPESPIHGEKTIINVQEAREHAHDGMRLANVGWLKDVKLTILPKVSRDELTAAIRTVNRYLAENRESYPSIVEDINKPTKITLTLTEVVE